METTLLLVDPDQLPPGLEDLLTAKGAFVETTTAEELEHAVIAVAPDLVVGARSQKLGRILGILARQDPVVQLVLLADWKEHRELRARRDPVIGALLSRDTPPSLLAGRIAEFGARAARGQPLQPTPSLIPPRTVDKGPAPVAGRESSRTLASSPTATKTATPSTKTSGAKAATSSVTASVSSGKTATSRATRTAGISAPRATETAPWRGAGGVAQVPRQPAVVAAKRTLIGVPAPGVATAPQKSAVVEPEAQESPPASESRLQPKAAPTTDPKPELARRTASGARPAQPVEPREEPSGTALRQEDAVDEHWGDVESPRAPAAAAQVTPGQSEAVERAALDATVLAPAQSKAVDRAALAATQLASPTGMPKNAPEPRVGPAKPNGLRDATSATSEASAPVESERVPLTFSRRPLPPLRLALVDTDLTRAGAIAEELRGRGVTTQLVAPDLDATRWHLLRRFAPHGLVMDEEAVGVHAKWLETIRLDPFLFHVPLVVAPLSRIFRESTGRADTSSLVPLLLSMGTEESALRDPMRASQSFELRLDQIGAVCLLEVLGERVRPTRLEAAAGEMRLEWPFAQGRAGTAALLRNEGPTETLSSAEALDWLLAHPESRIVVREAPDAQVSAANGVLVEELIHTATTQEVIPASPPPRSVRPSRRPPSAENANGAGGKPSPLAELGVWAQRAKAASAQTGARLLGAWRNLAPKARYAVLGGVTVLVGGLGYLTLGRNTAEAEPETEVPASQPEPAPPPAPKPAPPPGPEAKNDDADDLAALFRVGADAKLPACDDRSLVAGEPAGAANGYLQRARQQLVAGSMDTARELMCKAALLDPAGPASEGLAQLYLAGRSLDNAHHWAQVSLRYNPDRRTTKELLGDIASQRGQVKEARDIWLETMQLTGNETAKLEAVSRNQVREGNQAIRSRDLPRAERLFRRSITLDPKNAAAAVGLAQVYLELGEREAATRWARHAVRLDVNAVRQLPVELRE